LKNLLKNNIVIGTWPLSGDYGPVSIKQAIETLEYSYKEGFKTYDTAPNYGNGFAEFLIGKIFPNERDLKIYTKVGNRPFNSKSFNIFDVEKSISESLTRLNRDHLTGLLLHNPRNIDAELQKMLDYIIRIRNEGTIKYIGLSAAKGFKYESEFLENFDFIQCDVNLLYIDDYNYFQNKNKNIFARSPLGHGLLARHITSKTKFPSSDHRSEWLVGDRLSSITEIIEKLSVLFGEQDLKEYAIHSLARQQNIKKIVCGVKSPRHITFLSELLEKNLTINKKKITAWQKLATSNFGIEAEKYNGF